MLPLPSKDKWNETASRKETNDRGYGWRHNSRDFGKGGWWFWKVLKELIQEWKKQRRKSINSLQHCMDLWLEVSCKECPGRLKGTTDIIFFEKGVERWFFMHRERMWSWSSTKEVGKSKSHQDSPFVLPLVSCSLPLKGVPWVVALGSTVRLTAATEDCDVTSETDKAGKRDL